MVPGHVGPGIVHMSNCWQPDDTSTLYKSQKPDAEGLVLTIHKLPCVIDSAQSMSVRDRAAVHGGRARCAGEATVPAAVRVLNHAVKSHCRQIEFWNKAEGSIMCTFFDQAVWHPCACMLPLAHRTSTGGNATGAACSQQRCHKQRTHYTAVIHFCPISDLADEMGGCSGNAKCCSSCHRPGRSNGSAAASPPPPPQYWRTSASSAASRAHLTFP